MFTVYILRSLRDGRYYVGQCRHLESRLNRHNAGKVRSTKPFRPWIVVWKEHVPTRREALDRERKIKSRKKRAYIESIIRGVAQPG